MAENEGQDVDTSPEDTEKKETGQEAKPVDKKPPAPMDRLDKLISDQDPDFIDRMNNLSSTVSEPVPEQAAAKATAKLPMKERLFLLVKKPVFKFSLLGLAGALILPMLIMLIVDSINSAFSLPYEGSFMAEADEVYTFDQKREFIPLFDEFKSPLLIVSIPEVVTLLKAYGTSTKPFGRFSIELQARNAKSVDLIKLKERELIDISQRVFEQMTWKELSTSVGKVRSKKILVSRINKVLGGPFITNIYYSRFLTTK